MNGGGASYNIGKIEKRAFDTVYNPQVGFKLKRGSLTPIGHHSVASKRSPRRKQASNEKRKGKRLSDRDAANARISERLTNVRKVEKRPTQPTAINIIDASSNEGWRNGSNASSPNAYHPNAHDQVFDLIGKMPTNLSSIPSGEPFP